MAGSEWEALIGVYSGTPDLATNRLFRALIYGPPGSGKTTLAASFPNCFFIDTDRGMSSLRGLDIPFVQLGEKPFGQVYQILLNALHKNGPFAPGGKLANIQTIIIDSVSALADDYLLPETMIEARRDISREKASYDEYGKLKQRLIALSNLVKDLSSTYYVVYTALVDEEKNENTGDLRGKPLMTGKYRDKIGADFDEEWFLESQTIKEGAKRVTLHAADYRWFEAKSRNLKTMTLINPTFKMVCENFK